MNESGLLNPRHPKSTPSAFRFKPTSPFIRRSGQTGAVATCNTLLDPETQILNKSGEHQRAFREPQSLDQGDPPVGNCLCIAHRPLTSSTQTRRPGFPSPVYSKPMVTAFAATPA